MANVVDYARTTRDTFYERPLNEVDSLVFSRLAYLRIPEELEASQTNLGLTLAQIGNSDEIVSLVAPLHDPTSSEKLLRACAISPRFSLVRVCRTQDKGSVANQMQFSATTFMIPGGGAYLAFRGTDDTLFGWKESFNLGFSVAVPAQLAAREYVEAAARELDSDLWVGGHSKGGNLAVFGAMTCSDAAHGKIKACYSHDGPGFNEAAIAGQPWKNDWSLVHKTVPQESLVGMLLQENGPEPVVVRTTRPGIMQHSPFYWVVEGNHFATANSITYDAYRRNKRLNSWVRSMQPSQRERFIDVLYRITRDTGEVTLSGLIAGLDNDSLEFMLKGLDSLPASDKQFFTNQLEELAATMLLGPAPKEPKNEAERANLAQERVSDAQAKFNDRLSKLESFY